MERVVGTSGAAALGQKPSEIETLKAWDGRIEGRRETLSSWMEKVRTLSRGGESVTRDAGTVARHGGSESLVAQSWPTRDTDREWSRKTRVERRLNRFAPRFDRLAKWEIALLRGARLHYFGWARVQPLTAMY